MRTTVSIVAMFLMVFTLIPRVHAQSSHAAPQAALDAALTEHAASVAAEREAIMRVLGRSEVKAVAEKAGIDLRRVTGAAATLDGDDLARVAAEAHQVEQALTGGQSRIVISTTVIIIALLVLILIIVAVD
jgi:hypothetical protein